jgi:SAM-dependent methyltransferase
MKTARARSFDHMAQHFDRFAQLVGGSLDQYLESVIPKEGGQRALDLGCGTGRHASLLATRYQQVLAIDISEPMLDFATARRARPNIRYQHRDLRDVRRETDGSFDLVLSAYALHHIPDLDATLYQIRNLCARWGWVVLVDNVAPTPAVPRHWFVSEARRTLVADLRQHRRPRDEALELYRLSVDLAWLDHLESDRFLSPEQFTQRYREVFPTGRFTELYRSRAMCWEETTYLNPLGPDDLELLWSSRRDPHGRLRFDPTHHEDPPTH